MMARANVHFSDSTISLVPPSLLLGHIQVSATTLCLLPVVLDGLCKPAAWRATGGVDIKGKVRVAGLELK